jgi:hypothetical protein
MSIQLTEEVSRLQCVEFYVSLTCCQQVSDHIHPNVPEEHLEHDINWKQEQVEHRQHGHRKDAALELLGNDRVEMTDEQVSVLGRRVS